MYAVALATARIHTLTAASAASIRTAPGSSIVGNAAIMVLTAGEPVLVKIMVVASHTSHAATATSENTNRLTTGTISMICAAVQWVGKSGKASGITTAGDLVPTIDHEDEALDNPHPSTDSSIRGE